MRVTDLYSQVAQLGFEDSLEDDNRFYYAANRALLQVAAIRPATGVCPINHLPLRNLIDINTFAPIERTQDLSFEATEAKAYYFEAAGTGTLYIEALGDGGEWRVIKHVPFDARGNFIPYKGFIKDGDEYVRGVVRMRFVGEYLYSLRNVAMYQHILSNQESDIPPYEPFVRYDIRKLTKDFLSLESPPIIEDADNERLIAGWDLEGDSTILFSRFLRGSFRVLYRKKPRELENVGLAREDLSEIELDEELCSLLPTLVAAYVWVEDEPSMAEYYLNLYRERAFDIERRAKNKAPAVIRNRSGW